jgi:chromosome segregation ATPase
MKQIVALAMLLTSLVLTSGCETTGDPTKGGLIGWDENKAKARQRQLEQQQQRRQSLLARLNEDNQTLGEQNQQLDAEVSFQQQQLQQLFGRQYRLEAKLKKLQKEEKISTQQVKKLKEKHFWLEDSKSDGEALLELMRNGKEAQKQQALKDKQAEIDNLETEILLLIGY